MTLLAQITSFATDFQNSRFIPKVSIDGGALSLIILEILPPVETKRKQKQLHVKSTRNVSSGVRRNYIKIIIKTYLYWSSDFVVIAIHGMRYGTKTFPDQPAYESCLIRDMSVHKDFLLFGIEHRSWLRLSSLPVTLKAPITTAADDIHQYFIIVFQGK